MSINGSCMGVIDDDFGFSANTSENSLIMATNSLLALLGSCGLIGTYIFSLLPRSLGVYVRWDCWHSTAATADVTRRPHLRDRLWCPSKRCQVALNGCSSRILWTRTSLVDPYLECGFECYNAIHKNYWLPGCLLCQLPK